MRQSQSVLRGSLFTTLSLVALLAGAAWAPATPAAANPLPVVVPGRGRVHAPLSGVAALHVPVTLSAASTTTVTVAWTSLHVPGGPASPEGPQASASDFTASSGVVTFAPGRTSAHVTIPVNGDTAGGPEYVVVSFSHPSGAVMGGYWGLGFGLIVPPAGYGPVPSIEFAPDTTLIVPTGGPTLLLGMSLSTPTTHTVTLHWSTSMLGDYFIDFGFGLNADIPQAPAGDYQAASGTVTFLPGETTQTVPITVLHCTCSPIAGDVPPGTDTNGEVIWLEPGAPTGALIDSTTLVAPGADPGVLLLP